MIVDNIEHHFEAEPMSLIDKMLQLARPTIGSKRGKTRYAVVPPAPATGESSQGHEFHRSNTQLNEVAEPFFGRSVGALRGEGAHMKFVDDALLRRRGWLVQKRVAGVDHLGGTMHTKRQESGKGIRSLYVIQDKHVERPGPHIRSFEHEGVFSGGRGGAQLSWLICSLEKQQFNSSRLGRKNAKSCARTRGPSPEPTGHPEFRVLHLGTSTRSKRANGRMAKS